MKHTKTQKIVSGHTSYHIPNTSYSRGFSLIEVLVGTAVFLMVASAAYGLFVSLFKLTGAAQANILAVELADEQFEIIRNMPYTSVGLTNGIPLGILPRTQQNVIRGGYSFTVDLTVSNINLSTFPVQASDKLVEVSISCPNCRNFSPLTLTGQISPSNLQSAGIGGALVVKVFDANGQPVKGAAVDIQSMSTSTIADLKVTDNYGVLNVIGVPQGANAYQVIVSKPGYSTDRTYAIGGSNPNSNPSPTKPNMTVLNQQVSQISFAIDRLSTLNFSSVTPLCAPVSNYHFDLVGSKQIGLNMPKYSQGLSTNGSGILALNSMEWDTYAVTPTDSIYDISGVNPFSPFALNPNNTQSVQFVVVPKSGNSLMVSVIDSVSKLPVSGVTVQLTNSAGYNQSQITGQGYISQTDWSGGSGQNTFTTANKYWEDNGQVDTATSSGNIVMKKSLGLYSTTIVGSLESSTFDTGTSSNFYTFNWLPLGQPGEAGTSSVRFQFAAKPTATSTFSSADFFGPDGTTGTFYMVPGAVINNIHNGNEFARYKTFLSTATATATPMVSNVSFAYTSGCIPPGQVLFQSLTAGTYTISVSKPGYTTASTSVAVNSGWQEKKLMLSI